VKVWLGTGTALDPIQRLVLGRMTVCRRVNHLGM